MRRIGVFVRQLPPDAATAAALGAPTWTGEMVLLSDVYHALTGKPHPGRAAIPRDTRHLNRKLLEQRRRQQQRRAQLA